MRFLISLTTALCLIPCAEACKQKAHAHAKQSERHKVVNKSGKHVERHKVATKATATAEVQQQSAPKVEAAKPSAQSPAALMQNPPQFREMTLLSSNGRFRRATYKTVLIPVGDPPQQMPAADPKVEVPVEKLEKPTA